MDHMGDQHRYNAYISSKPLTDVYIKYNNLHEFVKQNRPVVMCTNEEIGCEITVFSLFFKQCFPFEPEFLLKKLSGFFP